MILVELEKEMLLRPLQSVTGIVERRHTLPILSNVMMESHGGNFSFTATDLEIQVLAQAEASGQENDFAITVSAKKFQDILRALPDGTKISLDWKENRLQVKAGKSRFQLQTLPAEDFPKLSPLEDANSSIKIPQKLFKHLLNQVQYAMAQQDIRYYLNGMLLVIGDNEIKVIATDGHRLSFASAKLDQSELPSQEVILPRKTVVELMRLLSDSDDEIELVIGKNQVKFSFSNITVTSKIVDGKFPDFNRVIPTGYSNHFTIDRLTLLQAMQRAAILSNEKFRGVRLVLTNGSLKVICTNTEQEEAEEELEIDYAGQPLDIGFNVTYLVDVLNNIDNSQVVCSFGDATSSGLLTIPGNDQFKYVVMPMRI